MRFEMKDGQLSLSLNVPEFTYVAHCLGAETVLGIGDPFLGWLTEEIEEAWEATSESLVKEGFITTVTDGVVTIDVVLAALVGVCAFPEATIFVSQKPKEGDEIIDVFHLGGLLSVRHEIPNDNGQELVLTLCESPEVATEQILKCVRMESNGELIDGSWKMALKTVLDVTAVDDEHISDVLLKENVPESISEAMRQTIVSDHSRVGLVGLRVVDDTWQLKGLYYLGSQDYVWKITTDLESDSTMAILETTQPDKAESSARQLVEEMIH